jgi:hypothetical protein
MINYIQTHIMQIGIPIAIVAGIGALIKVVPAYLESKAVAGLEYLFNKGDSVDDDWLIATIKWAEAKYGPGTGAVKAKAVVDKMVSLLPIAYRAFMSDKAKAKAVILFQSCFDRLEAVALKEAKDHEKMV